MTDPKSLCCVIASEPSFNETINKAMTAFHERVSREGRDYFFSATDARVYTIRVGFLGLFHRPVVELWFDRTPRAAAPNQGAA